MDRWRNGGRDIMVLEVLKWGALGSGVGTFRTEDWGPLGCQVVAELHFMPPYHLPAR